MASLLAIRAGPRPIKATLRWQLRRLRHIVCNWDRSPHCPLPRSVALFFLLLLLLLLLLPLPFVVFIGPLGSASAFHHAHSLH